MNFRFAIGFMLFAGIAWTAPLLVAGQMCERLVSELVCPNRDKLPVGYEPIANYEDLGIDSTLAEYFEARRTRDLATLVNLTLSLSFEHQDIERAVHRKGFDLASIHAYQHCAIAADESNPFHVWVLTAALFAVHSTNECHVTAFSTEWILLDDKWYTFPEAAPVLSGATKSSRPNTVMRVPLTEEEAKELERIADELAGRSPN